MIAWEPDALADLEAGRARLLKLTTGEETLVDADVFFQHGHWRWRLTKGRASRGSNAGKVHKHIFLHRLILGAVDKGRAFLIDHKNLNPLDNRRSNLRAATNSQNIQNSRLRTTSTTGLKGAHRFKGKFVSSVKHNGKSHHLGVFNTAQEAHAAYCEAAKRMFGEFWRGA